MSVKLDLPKLEDLYKPTLEALVALGGSGSIEEIDDAVVAALGLTQAALDVTYPKSGGAVVPDRLSWARSFLKIGGLATNPKRGVWVLTDEGRAAVAWTPAELRKFVSAADRKAMAARAAARAAEEGAVGQPEDTPGWSDLHLAAEREPDGRSAAGDLSRGATARCRWRTGIPRRFLRRVVTPEANHPLIADYNGGC